MTDPEQRRRQQEEGQALSTEPFADLVGTDVIDLILELAPRKVGSRVGKALDHYTKALRLIGVDDEMGAIRCIAAEEELVVAIFEWLKLNAAKVPEHQDFIRRYKNHYVKLAFYPVLSQFRFVLGDMLEDGITLDGLEDALHWQLSAVCVEKKVKLRIADQGKEIVLINPLAVAVSWGDRTDTEVVNELFKDFAKMIADQKGMTVREFVGARAEYRNKLLYAEDAGFGAMDEDLKALMDTVFNTVLRDLLWCLAVLLSDSPVLKDWGLVSQFIALYRLVLSEAKLI
jgi:hypothetical protein